MSPRLNRRLQDPPNDNFAKARAARRERLLAAGGPASTQSGSVSSANYPNRSTHPNNPYAPSMRESDARVALALQRLDELPDTALPPRRAGATIEHKGTGERRDYGVSPIGLKVMDMGGDDLRIVPPVTGAPGRNHGRGLS